MRKTTIITFAAALLMTGSLQSLKANEGAPKGLRYFTAPASAICDTVPVSSNANNGKPGETTVREVPKARRQPLPMPVEVKPVTIIKPKIIPRPVIRILP